MRRVKHHPAVPIDAMPAVYNRLRETDGMAALALRFVILTASRLGRAFSGRSRWRRAPQFLLGTVFVGLAARLAFDGRR